MSSTWASFIYDLDPNDCEGRNPGTANLPVYSVLKPQNIVCDANAITLAYVEQDDSEKKVSSGSWTILLITTDRIHPYRTAPGPFTTTDGYLFKQEEVSVLSRKLRLRK
jgi:hypothetical protein